MFFCGRLLVYFIFFSLYLSPLFMAAPTSSATSSTPTSLSSNSTSATPTSSTRSHRRTQTPTSFKAVTHTRTRPYIPPKVGTHLPARPTAAPDPEPLRGHHDGPPDEGRRRLKQKPVVIFFEVLGGIAGLTIVICLLRCYRSYRRTPRRDRIAEVVARHRLQREMEEIQQMQRARRPTSVVEPPPPYFPRPPSYAELGNQTALLSRTHSPSDSMSSISSASSHSRSDSDGSIYLAHPIAQSRLLQQNPG